VLCVGNQKLVDSFEFTRVHLESAQCVNTDQAMAYAGSKALLACKASEMVRLSHLSRLQMCVSWQAQLASASTHILWEAGEDRREQALSAALGIH
jgi:hypothetical protein